MKNVKQKIDPLNKNSSKTDKLAIDTPNLHKQKMQFIPNDQKNSSTQTVI